MGDDVTARILKSGDEPLVEEFLKPHLESSLFLLSNMRRGGLDDSDKMYQGTYVGLFQKDTMTDLAAVFWNGVLIFQAPLHTDDLMQNVATLSKRPISGLIGPDKQSIRAKAVLNLQSEDFQLDSKDGLYTLDLKQLVIPKALQSNSYKTRLMEARDLERQTRWRVAYSIETLGAEETPELWAQCRTSMEAGLEGGFTWILEVDGTPVSSTSFNATIQEAVQVGGVWTPPRWRGRGYARTAVAASLLAVRKKGAQKAILFTGDDNISAIKAYRALGFRLIDDFRLTLFKDGKSY